MSGYFLYHFFNFNLKPALKLPMSNKTLFTCIERFSLNYIFFPNKYMIIKNTSLCAPEKKSMLPAGFGYIQLD